MSRRACRNPTSSFCFDNKFTHVFQSFEFDEYHCLLGVPPHIHHNQAKTNKYPKMRKLTSSGENGQFFCFGGIIKFLS